MTVQTPSNTRPAARYTTSYKTVEAALSARDARIVICPECAGFFIPWRADQVRCGAPCTKRSFARNQARGTALLPLAMEWRITRGSADGSFAAMCNIIDGWHADDRIRLEKVAKAMATLKEKRKKMGL